MTSVLSLVMVHNLFLATRTLRTNRQSIHITCFVMNLYLAVLSVVPLLRDAVDMSCRVYVTSFFAMYVGFLTFSGIVLIIKAYYASNFSRKLLCVLIVLLAATASVHTYGAAQTNVLPNLTSSTCIFEVQLSSFTISMGTDFAFNTVVSGIFLVQIFKAHQTFKSSLYILLFQDGIVFWIVTSLFPMVLAVVAVIDRDSVYFPHAILGYISIVQPREGIEVTVLFYVMSSILCIVLMHNLYMASRNLRTNRQTIYLVCFTMNLLLAVISVIPLFRDATNMSCRVYVNMFFTLYNVCIVFSGAILILKVYYASKFSKPLLAVLGILLIATTVTHIYAAALPVVTEYSGWGTCYFTMDESSFIASMATDLAFNSLVSGLLLTIVFRAHRKRSSGLYVVLFKDGIVFWIITALFPIIIAVGSYFHDNVLANLVVAYVLVTSRLIVWQLRCTVKRASKKSKGGAAFI
ncbi:hypothetical protein IWQ60_002939 [Tieghemiomyces parasiticus]|uniref:Uncharacterized protein n=1 Tax=Tieghemiomyces parasiticus TaxID=78921 RepID=A0A9W8ABB3_9FUNG|nr:hypothetical protein IWQ60_002939 [Tieghemiomyces parasiticus]